MGHTEIYTKIKNLIKGWNFLPTTKIQTFSNYKIPKQILEQNINLLLEKNLALLEINTPNKGFVVNLEILLQSFESSTNLSELIQNLLKQNHQVQIKSITDNSEINHRSIKKPFSALPKILIICNICGILKDKTLKLINEINLPPLVVIDLFLIENTIKNHIIIDKKYNNIFVSDKTKSFNFLTSLNLKKDTLNEVIKTFNLNEIIKSHSPHYNYIVYIDENFSTFDNNLFLKMYNSFLSLKKTTPEALLLSYSENFSENYLKTFYAGFYSYIKGLQVSIDIVPVKTQPLSYCIFDSSLIKEVLPLSVEFNDPTISYYYNKWEKNLSEKITKLNLKQFNLCSYKT